MLPKLIPNKISRSYYQDEPDSTIQHFILERPHSRSTLGRTKRCSTPSVITWLIRGRGWRWWWWRRILRWRRRRSRSRCWLSWFRSGEGDNFTRLFRSPRTRIGSRGLHRPKSRFILSTLAVLLGFSRLSGSGADVYLADHSGLWVVELL